MNPVEKVDVLIIGGGVCGCSLLYALSRYKVRAVLAEKENDVGVGTTKANSAIVHAGYDPRPGTKMARYNVTGNALVRRLCRDLDILFKDTGSLVVGFDDEDRQTLEALGRRGEQNGVPGLEILPRDELLRREPGVSGEAVAALYAPTGAVVNPWELASAQAQAAVQGGAEVFLGCEVRSMRRVGTRIFAETERVNFDARFVVNAAGVHAGEISEMLEKKHFHIHPNRGQYHLLDTTQGSRVSHVVFQCPTNRGKGVLVAPTVHGNLIVGPDSQAAAMDDVSTTAQGLDFVRQRALRSVPGIDFRDTIRHFAGLRAVADVDDFVVGESKEVPGFFNMAGIKSPGLTCAPAIAGDIVDMLARAGLALAPNPNFAATRRVLRFKHLDEAGKRAAIARNPLYGRIVCRCATYTEGEIVDALRAPLPPRSLDAVKRRCGPGMGRCQGGFCGPRVQAIIARELGIPPCDVPQDKAGMTIVTGRTKGEGGC